MVHLTRRLRRRNSLIATLCAGVLASALLVPRSTAQERSTADQAAAPDAERSAAELVTPATTEAARRGLDYLASHQRDDGALGADGYSRNAAVCALAGMAFMSSGSTPARGPYGRNVDRCIDFILEHSEPSGFITVNDSAGHGPMYGHGFAAMFLGETYGMSPRVELRDKLMKAIGLIVGTQNKEGGWRYQPQPQDADISVTICQIMALRAARNAGLTVPRETIDRAIDYVKRSQNADGGFMYMLQGGPSAFPRSAAGVVALYSAGVYRGAEIDKGLEYLDQYLPVAERGNREGHYFYAHYYAVQAMWQAGGQRWARWYPAVRDDLLGHQARDGSWPDSISNEYGTAMACIILQMPNNYLPIFQR